ncbi:3-dehydrosphinganine reductase [Blomia tropicalis]|nr:3-dehydrosphinganine reductase [Blomia tropicalis]
MNKVCEQGIQKQCYHDIPHRFRKSVNFSAICRVCGRQSHKGYTCRDCKYHCHTECRTLVPNSCGLSDQLLKHYMKTASITKPKIVENETNKIEQKWKQKENKTSILEHDEEQRMSYYASFEWNIPSDQLLIEGKVGSGRFGTVYSGQWHGKVAIKKFHMTVQRGNCEYGAFNAFREAVSVYRKTRHQNLALFMGASVNPPYEFAIVTTLCNGGSLHTHIHVRGIRFSLERVKSIIKQIRQGISYLHGRNIVHTNLSSQNVFYENAHVKSRIILTDFGGIASRFSNLFTFGDGLPITRKNLLYLPPEIIRQLKSSSQLELLPFTFASDIYSFGTILYELLFVKWPFENQSMATIIWQAGNGVKSPMPSITIPSEYKDLVSMCWNNDPNARPELGHTMRKLIKQLPIVESHRYTQIYSSQSSLLLSVHEEPYNKQHNAKKYFTNDGQFNSKLLFATTFDQCAILGKDNNENQPNNDWNNRVKPIEELEVKLSNIRNEIKRMKELNALRTEHADMINEVMNLVKSRNFAKLTMKMIQVKENINTI